MATASTFVDGALQDIESLGKNFLSYNYRLKNLRVCLRNLRTFLLCASSSSSSVMGSLLSGLEDSLTQNGKDFHNLCLSQKESRMSNDLFHVVIQLENCIKSFSYEIIESYITLSDFCSWQSGYQLKEFFDSLLINMADIMSDPYFYASEDPDLIDAFKDKLVSFKNFIRFAELRGIEPWQLKVLLTRLHVVAINTARLCHEWMFDKAMFIDEFQLKFSDLFLKIEPVDPQIREIYIHTLTASNVPGSSHSLSLERDRHVLGDFVDTLLCNFLEALTYSDTNMVSLKDQVSIFNEGLRFLRTILKKHLEKIDELHNKAKDLIGAAVNEAAIVICLLPETDLEEGLVKKIDFALLNFLERIKLIKVVTSAFIFSETNEHGFVDFLLENLKELSSCTVDSISFAKDQTQTAQEDLVSLRPFLESIVDNRKHDEKLQSLWNRVVDVAYKTHFVILSLVVGDIPDCSTLEEEINRIKLESLKIVGNQYYSDHETQEATNTSNPLPSQGSTPVINNIMVTLDDEANTIIEHLKSESKKLDIISIVGMPGLGKTTLARSVYNNPPVRDLFHTSAWCVVSQVYKKKDLLLRILGSVDPNFSDDKYSKKKEEDLEETLKKCLLRRRYLIVLDDVWDIEAWRCLERSFPDDSNSSKILLTSRDSGVAKKIYPYREPHPLRLLTDDECWDLLQKKLSCIKSYPLDLGMKIAKHCRGLPLTVVTVAGILANSNQDGWERIAGRLSSSVLSVTDQCIDILELSFKKLPKNLKSCLLYFGSFPEDEEIPVKKLIWFWIAEGFIKSEPKSLEDMAKDYMNNLIDRNLVMVTKERSIGGVKTCQIHDLLHEFCVVRAKEKKFMSLLSGHDELFTFLGERDLQRLCVHSTARDFEKSKLSCPGVRSLLFFAKENNEFDYKHYHISFIFHFFKLLEVLDLTNIHLGSTFPSEIELLVELRYLAIRGGFVSIPSAVAKLSNLETFLLYANFFILPDSLWNMQKLKVLWSSGLFCFHGSAINNLEGSLDLHNLETFSRLELFFGQSLEKILRKLPNIRRLKCQLYKSGKSNADCNGIVVMDFLSQLESLHLRRLSKIRKYHIGFHFPKELKKLHLSGFHSSIIPKRGELPNLVVLKLQMIDFEGGTWDMNEDSEFPNLKYLELDDLRINRWTGTEGVDHFPCLEKLVLNLCRKLKEVPSCLGYIETLQTIEVSHCPKSVESSIMQIKDDQKDNLGAENLQVLLSCISDDKVEDEASEDETKDDPSEDEREDETSDDEMEDDPSEDEMEDEPSEDEMMMEDEPSEDEMEVEPSEDEMTNAPSDDGMDGRMIQVKMRWRMNKVKMRWRMNQAKMRRRMKQVMKNETSSPDHCQ